MIKIIAITLSLIFLLIAAIHFYWAFGGKWASSAVLPTKADNVTKVLNPSLLPTLIVAIGLLAVAVFVLIKANLVHFNLPLWLLKYGLWIIAAIFILRAIGDFKYAGLFKTIKQTTFGKNDTKYYSPLCLIIGILAMLLILLK